MVSTIRTGLFALFLLTAGVQGASVTPMEKVIGLLKGLSTKVAAEGAKEAAGYDKYACFCKEQADEKLYAIEKSDDKIANLKASIKELDSAISELNGEISDLNKKISGLAGTIKKKTADRKKDHDAYAVKAKDMNQAIDACGAAIDALKDSKKSMSGAKVDLAQISGAILSSVEKHNLADKAPGAMLLLSQLKAAPKFEYQSNDIIATLEGLQATFKSMKKDLDVEEFDTNSSFEKVRLGLQNEMTFKQKESDEKTAVVESKTEEMEANKSDRDAEQDDRDADQAFMDDLTLKCEEKARLFDQRSKLRSEELTTLSEATAELEKGAVPNFSANKALVGFQKEAAVTKAAIKPVSFVQVENVQHGRTEVVQKVLAMINGAAGKMNSNVLRNFGMRVKMAEDHFVKVRALIKDLILKLKDDAKAEASQKSYCDKNMKKAVTDRDNANSNIEVASAKITSLKAKKNALKEDISTLEGQIADLQKALLEATELRADDKEENTKTMTMSKEAIDSVKLALGMLKQFYSKAGFMQKYTPPKGDRSGNTVGDLAPDSGFDSEYKGGQSESKGIVGILEVILSDFERTNGKAKSDDKDSKEAFELMEKETKKDIAAKEKLVKKKEGEVSDAKSDILDQESALSDAKDLLESSQEALEGLELMCVKGEETWEERKAKREEEIEALKTALTTLEEWQA